MIAAQCWGDSVASIAARQRLMRALPAALAQAPWASMVALAKDAEAYLDSTYIICPDAHARCMALLRTIGIVARGESLYLAEVRRVKSVVNAVADGAVVVALLDEVFRGTNRRMRVMPPPCW